jgi:tetratricopeptide (TPR) repeat protein
MTARRTFAVAALLVSGIGMPAFADTPPSRWDRARDPTASEAWELHTRVREFMAPLPDEVLGLRELRLQQARTELESANAAESADVRLRFDLGQVYEELSHNQQAIDVLQPALAMAPDHPAAADAWLELAFAYARMDRSREERDAYDAYLVRAPYESGRATALLNRAEAEMRLGNLEDAVLGYRDAIDACDSASMLDDLFKTGVLARWGLAVALDRSGDATGAVREALVASQLDPREGIIDSQEMCGTSLCVFFVPDYERDWYLGLGRAEHAKQELDPRKAALLWKRTEEKWADYILRADPKDRWLPLAKAHLSATQKRRAVADKRAGVRRPASGNERLIE